MDLALCCFGGRGTYRIWFTTGFLSLDLGLSVGGIEVYNFLGTGILLDAGLLVETALCCLTEVLVILGIWDVDDLLTTFL